MRSEKDSTFNWGLIGLGNIAHQFVRDLLLVEGTKAVAVASRQQAKASLFAAKYGIPTAYGSYQDILKEPEVDIIYIATPHDSHAALSIAALNAGKHVLCEKPVAVNSTRLQEMVHASRTNRRFLMEAFWSAFNPGIRSCLKTIEDRTIGMVNYVNADFSFYRKDPDDSRMLAMKHAGGSLLEMGVYPLFLAYSIFGKPEEILATSRFHKTGADMQTAAILKFPDGIANMLSGFASQSDMVAKIYGTEGRIYIHPYWHETQGYTLIQGNDGSYQTKDFHLPTKGKGFTYEIEECLQCIENGEIESRNWSHQNSLDLMEIVDEIRRQSGLIYPFERNTQK